MSKSINGHLASQFCGMTLPAEVLQSNAGFYIGTYDPKQGPISRESAEYWPTRAEADDALRTGDWTQKLNP